MLSTDFLHSLFPTPGAVELVVMVAVVVALLKPATLARFGPKTGDRGGRGEVDLGLAVSVTANDALLLVGDVAVSFS